MNGMGDDLLKTVITERRTKIVWPPQNHGIFFPLHAAFDTFHP